jgi:hypothetical protein
MSGNGETPDIPQKGSATSQKRAAAPAWRSYAPLETISVNVATVASSSASLL